MNKLGLVSSSWEVEAGGWEGQGPSLPVWVTWDDEWMCSIGK